MSEIGLPTTRCPATLTFSLRRNVTNDVSPLGMSRQRVERAGAHWTAAVQMPPLIGDEAGRMAAWLDQATRGDRWLLLDKRTREVGGSLDISNAVANGYFDVDLTGWTVESGGTISRNAGRLKLDNDTTDPIGALASVTVDAGVPYVVVVDVDPGTADSATVQLRNATSFAVEGSRIVTAPTRVVFPVTPSQAAMQIRLVANSPGYLFFRNVTVSRAAMVLGSGFVGRQIDVEGLPVSSNGLLLAGDFFCVKCGGSYELKRLTDDLDSDASGNGVLQFEPVLRNTPDSDSPVVFYRPWARFIMPEAISVLSVQPADVHNFSFQAEEDVTTVAPVADTEDATGELIWEFDADTLSLEPTHGTGTPTMTRAGATATRVNSSGLIEVVAADTPRFDYDPVTLALKGLLIEEARTNVAWPSADITHANYNKILGVTVLANQAIAPDGTLSMDRSTFPGAVSGERIDFVSGLTASGQTGAFSVWLSGTGTITISCRNSSGGTDSDQRVTLSATPTRFSVVCVFGGAAGNIVASLIIRNTALDTARDVDIWGWQLEVGAFATSHIPTTTASVARNADVCSALLSAIAGFDASQVTVFVEGYAAAGSDSSINQYIASLENTGSENVALRRPGGTLVGRLLVVDGGVTQADIASVVVGNSSLVKMAGAAALNDVALSVNGNAVVTDASATMPTPTQIVIGSRVSTQWWNGHIRKLRLYSRRLTNAELIALTS